MTEKTGRAESGTASGKTSVAAKGAAAQPSQERAAHVLAGDKVGVEAADDFARAKGLQSSFRYDAATGTIHVLKWSFATPKSRRPRIALGIALVIGGLLGFLPILGYWMVPIGLLVLSRDFAFIRRWRRSLALYWGRRRQR
jgi:hypothetical protein